MQRSFIILAGLALLALPMKPFAADKFTSSMNPPNLTPNSPPPLSGPESSTWTYGKSRGSAIFRDNCKVSVKLSKTSLADSDGIPGTGDEVICLMDGNSGFTKGGFVLRGESINGSVKINVDLSKEGFTCSGFTVHDIRFTCYEPDAGYSPSLTPFLSDPTQGVTDGFYPPRPANGLIATDSVSFP